MKCTCIRRNHLGQGLLAVLLIGCGCHARNDGASPIAVTESSSSQTVVPLLSRGDGETVSMSVSGRESSTCMQAQVEPPAERPCRRFVIAPRRRGTLVVTLRWDNAHPLLIAATTDDGMSIGDSCCRSPQVMKFAVEPTSAYEVQIMLVTAWGRDEHQRFELAASLEF